MGPRHLFTISGIPVSIDPFFVLGAFFLYQWSGGGTPGLYSVIAIAVFVLVHELGHAFTAKAFGAESTVMLTFMGGFANYRSPKRLTVAQQVAISAAGPLVQLIAATPVLWFAQHTFQTATTRDQAQFGFDLYVAVAWAGVLLAFLNLLPLWPLDGGHICDHVLGRLIGRVARKPFIYWTMAVSSLVLAMYLLGGSGSGTPSGFVATASRNFTLGVMPGHNILDAIWLFFRSTPGLLVSTGFFIPAFCLFGSYARLQQLRQQDSWIAAGGVPTQRETNQQRTLHEAQVAERSGWSTGVIPEYPSRFQPSPWLRAHVALRAGRSEEAVQALRTLTDGPARTWVLDTMDHPELEVLLQWVPPEAQHCLATLEARVFHGSPEDLVSTARACFDDERSAEPWYLGAEGLALRGMADEAMQWLAGAVQLSPDPHRMGTARGLRTLHSRSDFQQLLGEAERALADR